MEVFLPDSRMVRPPALPVWNQEVAMAMIVPICSIPTVRSFCARVPDYVPFSLLNSAVE